MLYFSSTLACRQSGVHHVGDGQKLRALSELTWLSRLLAVARYPVHTVYALRRRDQTPAQSARAEKAAKSASGEGAAGESEAAGMTRAHRG